MNKRRVNALGCFVTGMAALCLGGCATDPNQKKAEYLRSGEAYAKAGRYQEAVIQYRNAIQIDGNYAEARYKLGQMYVTMNELAAAKQEFSEVGRLNPKNLEARLQLARVQTQLRAFGEAQSTLEGVLAADPGNVRAHVALSENFALAKDLPNAVREMERAVELDPGKVESYAALGALLASAGRLAEAETAYVKGTETNPASVSAWLAVAHFYFAQGKMGEAEANVRRAASVDPAAALPRLLMGRIYASSGRLAQAEEAYTEAKQLGKDDPKAYQALGEHYWATGQRDKALAEFKSNLQARPQSGIAKQRVVAALIDLGRIKEADPLNEELLKQNQQDQSALVAEGRIRIAEGRFQDAAQALHKAVVILPEPADGHFYLGVAEQSLGLTQMARGSFSKALSLNPQLTDAAVSLARLSLEEGDPNAAERLSETALRANPNSVGAYVASAKAAMAKGDVKEAEARLMAALSRDPASLDALSALLSLDVRRGKAPESVRRLERSVEQNPKNAGLRQLLALGYLGMGDVKRSEVSAREAQRLDEKTPEIHTLLANINFAKGASAEGKRELEAAIAASPRNFKNYLALAQQLEQEGNWEAAKRLCIKAREIAPNSWLVSNQLAYLYLEHAGDINEALALARAAQQAMPDSPNVADTMGWAYYKAGRHEEAISEFNRCLKLAPGNATCNYHLGMAYSASGQPQLAQSALRQAIQSDPNFPYAKLAKAELGRVSKTVN